MKYFKNIMLISVSLLLVILSSCDTTEPPDDKPGRRDYVWTTDTLWSEEWIGITDVWAVGDNGTIIHWDGEKWEKVKSNVDISINDVWGESTNQIYATGYKNPDYSTSTLLKYNGSKWLIISTIQSTGYEAETVWKTPGGKVITGGRALLEFDESSYSDIYIQGRTRYIEKIWGSGPNNIFTCGHFGEITHFDGLNWKDIENFEVPTGTTRIFYSLWSNENKVFICGREQSTAIIINGSINY